MKSKILYVWEVVLAAFLFALPLGCISEFNAVLPVDDEDVLIVTGNIIAHTEVDFVLSKGFSINKKNPPGESQDVAATVTIVGSDGSQSAPAASMGAGVYRISVGELRDDVAYGIRIEYGGNVYTSTPATPLSTPEIDTVTFVQPEEYGDIYMRVSTHDDTATEPLCFVWTYVEDWEYPARNYTRLYLNEQGNIDTMEFNDRYNCWKKNTRNEILAGTTEGLIANRLVNKQLLGYPSSDERFRSLYCLTLTQRAITKAGYEYYLSKKTENEEMGGLFTPQPNEVGGNITCETDPSKRIIGYVSVLKNISWKRLFIDSFEISRDSDYACTLISKEEIDREVASSEMTTQQYLLKNRLNPIGDWEKVKDGAPIIIIEGYVKDIACVDCVEDGGTKNKPDFWPNDKR